MQDVISIDILGHEPAGVSRDIRPYGEGTNMTAITKAMFIII